MFLILELYSRFEIWINRYTSLNLPRKWLIICIAHKRDNSQPREGNLSTINVPRLPYESVDPLQNSKSPARFRNNNFRSPPGRNINNSFNTINQSHNNIGSINMKSPMASMSKNMYPGNEMSSSFAEMSQNYPGGHQYM